MGIGAGHQSRIHDWHERGQEETQIDGVAAQCLALLLCKAFTGRIPWYFDAYHWKGKNWEDLRRLSVMYKGSQAPSSQAAETQTETPAPTPTARTAPAAPRVGDGGGASHAQALFTVSIRELIREEVALTYFSTQASLARWPSSPDQRFIMGQKAPRKFRQMKRRARLMASSASAGPHARANMTSPKENYGNIVSIRKCMSVSRETYVLLGATPDVQPQDESPDLLVGNLVGVHVDVVHFMLCEEKQKGGLPMFMHEVHAWCTDHSPIGETRGENNSGEW